MKSLHAIAKEVGGRRRKELPQLPEWMERGLAAFQALRGYGETKFRFYIYGDEIEIHYSHYRYGRYRYLGYPTIQSYNERWTDDIPPLNWNQITIRSVV